MSHLSSWKQGKSCTSTLRMLTFNVYTEMMTLFYRSVIESVLTFCIIAWFENLSGNNRLGSVDGSLSCCLLFRGLKASMPLSPQVLICFRAVRSLAAVFALSWSHYAPLQSLYLVWFPLSCLSYVIFCCCPFVICHFVNPCCKTNFPQWDNSYYLYLITD